MSQFPSQGEKENPLKTAPIKDTVADSDGVVLVDGQDVGTKRVLWSTIKSALGQIFAPLTRKINNKPLSSDVVLTGDDIATSVTDGTTVSSSLSNLVGTALPDRWMTIPVGKKLWFYTGGQNGYYLMNDGTDFAIYDHDNHELFSINYARTPTIQGDVALATATPPQEFDLPLADGISDYATSVYHKNQFSEVSVRVSVSATNAIQNGATIATLPEGFRPAKAIDTDATGYVSGSSWFACRLVIQSSGAVQIYWGIGSSPATFIVGSFAPYLAVD